MDNKKPQKKKAKKFICEPCDFFTSNRRDFNRHLLIYRIVPTQNKRIVAIVKITSSLSKKVNILKKATKSCFY